MSIKSASHFMCTIVSTCALIKKLTGHAFDIFISPAGIFVVILVILRDMSLGMSSPNSIYGFGLSKIFDFALLHMT